MFINYYQNVKKVTYANDILEYYQYMFYQQGAWNTQINVSKNLDYYWVNRINFIKLSHQLPL